MPVRQRIRIFWPILALWVAVMVVGFLGALIEFRRQNPILLAELVPFPASPAPASAEPLLFLDAKIPPPDITASQVWIFDRKSESLLFEKNSQTATSVASLAKLMTAYVAYETYDLTTELTVGAAATAEGNRAKFLASDVFSVRELLQALLMFSANDAAETLAQADSQEKKASFISRMNQRAQDLGLQNTHFQNVTGLDHEEQYSSSEDIGRLVHHFLETPFFSQTVRQQVTQITENTTGRTNTIYTTNSMLYRDPQFTGVKTGTTDMAGQSLVLRLENTWSIPTDTASTLVDQPVDLIFVILGSQDRYQDAQNVSDWIKEALRIRQSSLS